MSIPTTRTKNKASILIDESLCNGCGKCVDICSDFDLELFNFKVRESANPVFGCIACGNCMLVCPTNAIKIEGRCLTATDIFELPSKELVTDFKSLLFLLKRRRSIRNYKDQIVEPGKIDQILEAAQTAPMGIPPSDVHVLVLENKAVVSRFAAEYSVYLKSMRWFASGWFQTIMRPFWGKANDEMMQSFIKPLFDVYIDKMEKGENWINYDAPLAMYFYGSPYSDPADPIIAATYAMIAGESLGLVTCMLGAIHPFIQNGKNAEKFRKKWGVKYKSREGLFVIFGYPNVSFKRGVKRSFADINRIGFSI